MVVTTRLVVMDRRDGGNGNSGGDNGVDSNG